MLQIKTDDRKLDFIAVSKTVFEAKKKALYDDLETLLECVDKDGIRKLFQLIESVGADVNEFERCIHDTVRTDQFNTIGRAIKEDFRMLKDQNTRLKERVENVSSQSKSDLLNKIEVLNTQCLSERDQRIHIERQLNQLVEKQNQMTKTIENCSKGLDSFKLLTAKLKSEVTLLQKEYLNNQQRYFATIQHECTSAFTDLAGLRKENEKLVNFFVLMSVLIAVTLAIALRYTGAYCFT